MRRLVLFLVVAALFGCGPKPITKEVGIPKEPEINVEEELEIARAYYEKGRVGDAAEHYQRVIERDSTSFEANLYLALALLTMEQARFASERDFSTVRRFLLRAASLEPDDPKPLFYLGKLDFDKGEYETAVVRLRRVVGLESDNSEAHAMLGTALAELGRIDEAKAELIETLKLDPDNALANFTLGKIFEREGKRQPAIVYLERAVKMNPNNDEATYILEKLYYDTSLYGRAEDACQRFLRYHPDDVQSLEILGWIYRRQGRTDEMLSVYERLARLRPENTLYWGVLIQHFMARAMYDRAFDVITESLKHNPYYAYGNLQYAQLLIMRGDDLYRSGDSRGALKLYLEAKDSLAKARLDDRYEQVAVDLLAKVESRIRNATK